MQYPMTVDKDKEIQEAAKNLVIELEHLLSLVEIIQILDIIVVLFVKGSYQITRMAIFVKTESILKRLKNFPKFLWGIVPLR